MLLLTVFVSGMVHCRSALGHWKLQQRSFNRGYARHPCVRSALAYIVNSVYCSPFGNTGIDLPPPPPPVFHGVELNRPQVRRDWNDYSDDEPEEKIEEDCPMGVVTFLVDAPLAIKDILCREQYAYQF